MPDCLVDTGLIAAAVFGYLRVRGSARERERRRKFGALSKISQQAIQRDFSKDWPVTRNVEQKLPIGADSSASAALRAVQQYQDARAPPEPRGPSLPACWLGFVYFGGCEDTAVHRTDAETAVCEELKLWLLSAAMGAVPAEEASRRLHLYHQILMRPEVFNEAGFLPLIATVCERLDELVERLEGAMRTCALQLNKVMNIGRDLVNGLMPLLVLAITDAIDDGTLPLLCVDVLLHSALNAEIEGRGGGLLAGLWAKDSGRLLRELLCSPHLRQLWAYREDEETPGAAGRPGVPAVKVEVYHKWEDALDEGRQLGDSGLFEAFARKDSWRIQASYLRLFESLDKFVKFLSMIEPYKVMANIAGDAAMYRLRGTLHHLLQEVELALVQVETDASKVLEAAKRTVIDMALREPSPPRDRLRWLERLQLIDEQAQGRSYSGLVAAVAELRYLTCDARLPELQAACQRSLGQISDITASLEFRSRCAELPPDASRLALAVSAGISEAPPEHTLLAIQGAPAWSVERQFRLGEEEVQGLEARGRAGCLGTCLREELGSLVESLNQGAIPDPGDFYVVRFTDTQEYVSLYKSGGREAAVETLGLNESHWQAQPPQAVSVESGSLLVAEEEERAPEAAVLPLFEQSEALTRQQALLLLGRSEPELPAKTLQWILEAEMAGPDRAGGLVDRQALQRMGELVAHAQAGRADLAALRGSPPDQVPRFRGLLWDPQRPKKVSVLEPF